MSGNNHPRSFRERLALISGVDLEQLDGLETDESEEMYEFEPNLARLVRKIIQHLCVIQDS